MNRIPDVLGGIVFALLLLCGCVLMLAMALLCEGPAYVLEMLRGQPVAKR